METVIDLNNLPEGYLAAHLMVSHAHHLAGGYGDKPVEQVARDQAEDYLKVMPKGTEIVSVSQQPILGLAVPFVVIFKNPLLQAYKAVDLEYTRHAAVVDDKLEQFNLLTGIKYFPRDRKEGA